MKDSAVAGSGGGLNDTPVHALAAGLAAQASTRAPTCDGFNLAFIDAGVRRVADAVLGSMLEFDYSVDPAVSGNITLRTRRPVSRGSLIPLLESALRSVDAVLVVQGASYRVVPREGARTRAPLAAAGGDTPIPGYATEMVTLGHGSVVGNGAKRTWGEGRKLWIVSDEDRCALQPRNGAFPPLSGSGLA